MMNSTLLRWQTHPNAGAMHAAEVLVAGHTPVDPRCATALEPSLNELRSALAATPDGGHRFWEHAVPLSIGNVSERQWVEIALRKAYGAAGSIAVEALAAAIGAVIRAFHAAYPQCREELGLRVGPLRQLWEARAAGFLRRAAFLTEEALLPPAADLLLVQPVSGGAGRAYLAYNAALLEGVLANPRPSLPETVRLGWLLLQLQLEVPRFGERVHAARLADLAALAMIPPALSAATHVEWITGELGQLPEALEYWLGISDAETSEGLLAWWETYCENRPPFAVALQALERIMYTD